MHTHFHHKWQSYDVWFLRYGAQQTISCHSEPFFALLPSYGPRKSKFWKNEKNSWRYYNFTNLYHKWQSYDVWLQRYGVQWTEFFAIPDHFLLLYPLTTQKIKILKKWKKKKTTGDMDRFLPFYPLTTQKINILQKMKKILEILSFYTSIS